MRLNLIGWAVPCLLLGLAAMPQQVVGQMVHVTSPFQTNSDSFFERIGVDFGFSIPGSGNVVGLNPDGSFTQDGAIHFRQGSAGSAIPPFGGFDPNSGAQIGFARRNGRGGGFSLNLFAGKGSNRTSSVTAPSVVVPNGVPGSIFSGQQTPFVTGIVPIVGGYFPPQRINYAPRYSISPLQLKLAQLKRDQAAGIQLSSKNRDVSTASAAAPTHHVTYSDEHSTARTGDISVAEIRRQRDLAMNRAHEETARKIQELVETGEDAVNRRKFGYATVCYQQAIRLASGQQQQELKIRLEEIRQLKKR